MSCKDSLGDRMKAYESMTNFRMMRRLPVIIRLDGKNFSSLTKRTKCKKPFDDWFMSSMANTMTELASRMQGCVIGYTQSDEISFVLFNDRSIHDEPYFDNRVQKIVSVAASMATAVFNRGLWKTHGDQHEANFDARAFTVPSVIEATNALIWRQQDCTRNSILSAAYYELGKKFGRGTAQKMMHGNNTSQLQEILYQHCGINWSTHYDEYQKRGTIAIREKYEIHTDRGSAVRCVWNFSAAPIFQSEEGRRFLLNLFVPPEAPNGEDDE